MRYGPRIKKELPQHIRRERDGDCPQHRTWIRQQPCVVQNSDCAGVLHAHHVRSAATAGTGMKPPDWACVPMCAYHHRHLHNIGAQTFEKVLNVVLEHMASDYAQRSPALRKVRQT